MAAKNKSSPTKSSGLSYELDQYEKRKRRTKYMSALGALSGNVQSVSSGAGQPAHHLEKVAAVYSGLWEKLEQSRSPAADAREGKAVELCCCCRRHCWRQ